MSNSIAILCVTTAIKELQTRTIDEFLTGNFEGLELLHHLTAGVKYLATQMCYVGLDEMRQSCGGAGFLMTSGLAEWWSDIGVNPIMMQ